MILMYTLAITIGLTGVSECPTSSCHPSSLVIPLPAEVKLHTGTAPVSGPVAEVVDEKETELGDEGYTLECHQEGYRITARTKRGLFYGKQTLAQMKRLGLIPCCTIEDKPAMGMRAVMFDMARLKEKHEYYYHVIDQLAQWKINTVFLHLTDKVGCAIEFKKYPGIATKYAFTQDEMRKLIKYASDRQIELIPEIESWGHATYITGSPGLADLGEQQPGGGSLCPSNPKTYEVLADLFAETAALFPSKYIHAGCDEAAFGQCPKCKAKIGQEGEATLVGEHLARVHDLVKAAGKVPMMWGDVLLSHRDSTKLLPTDTIICHWAYNPNLSPEPFEFLQSKGYEVVGCPAIVWGSRMILPMAETFDNVANTAKIVLDKKLMGMETTIWIPQRYITDTLYFALAHACELSWSGQKRTRIDFAAAFAKNYFGLDPTAEFAQALIDIHGLSTKSYSVLQNLRAYAAETGKKGEPELLVDANPVRDKAKSIAKLLREWKPKVTSNEAEYDALILAAEVRAHVEDRALCVRAVVRAMRAAPEMIGQGRTQEALKLVRESIKLTEKLAAEDTEMAKRVEQAWDRVRYADDPKKKEGENLLVGFTNSREFLADIISRLKSADGQVEKGETVDWAGILK